VRVPPDDDDDDDDTSTVWCFWLGKIIDIGFDISIGFG
jgi:hypothetical protein